jgi:malate dehydrogenase
MVNKITVFGSGAVGATLAYNLLSRVSFSELVLIDINDGIAKGTALDLEDTRGLLNFPTKILAGNSLELMKDSDIVVFTAGVARKDGMTRMDLLKINGQIAFDTAKAIKTLAPQAIVIAVSNPLDVITYIFTRALDFGRKRVFGMGSSLDTSRMLGMVSNESGVNVTSIDGYVFGAHSEDMIVSGERLRINGEGIDSFLGKPFLDALPKRVQLRGAEIVGQLKNRSAYFAPSLAVCRLIEAISKNTREVIPVAVLLDGELGAKDICMGVSCVIGRGGIEEIVEPKLSHKEEQDIDRIEKVFQELKEVLPVGI